MVYLLSWTDKITHLNVQQKEGLAGKGLVFKIGYAVKRAWMESAMPFSWA